MIRNCKWQCRWCLLNKGICHRGTCIHIGYFIRSVSCWCGICSCACNRTIHRCCVLIFFDHEIVCLPWRSIAQSIFGLQGKTPKFIELGNLIMKRVFSTSTQSLIYRTKLFIHGDPLWITILGAFSNVLTSPNYHRRLDNLMRKVRFVRCVSAN